jgi:hypothetical protein
MKNTTTTIHYTYTSPKGVQKKTYFSSLHPITITTQEAINLVKNHGIGINPTFTKITITNS